MEKLSSAGQELVALGAALGSNCVPCIEYHIPEARKAGLSDSQINEAILLADRVRQVPAGKVLSTALGLLSQSHVQTNESGAGCLKPTPAGKAQRPCCT